MQNDSATMGTPRRMHNTGAPLGPTQEWASPLKTPKMHLRSLILISGLARHCVVFITVVISMFTCVDGISANVGSGNVWVYCFVHNDLSVSLTLEGRAGYATG